MQSIHKLAAYCFAKYSGVPESGRADGNRRRGETYEGGCARRILKAARQHITRSRALVLQLHYTQYLFAHTEKSEGSELYVI